MGKTIVSWSPVHGQGATTSNIVALASLYSLTHESHSLITHTQLNYSSLESLFEKKKTGISGFEDSGLVAIERLINSNLIKPEAVHDYTETIYSGRLDLLGGTYSNDEVTEKMLGTLLKVTENAYDLVWVDAHSGTRNDITRKTLNNADLIIVNLPQNRFVLDHFFLEEFPNELKGKNIVYIISQYNTDSQFNLRKIKRRYNIKEMIYALPFCGKYKEAINNSKVTEYFYTRVANPKKDATSWEFFHAVNAVNKHINKKYGLVIGVEA
ncbi:MAG: hypothetical protein KBT36_11785 [Kurthia sp.]|nr:hypothetical protein [Candidatus Kurthia equi]